ncbi:MAG: TIGR02281 family clan AA aspartic protease [Rhodobiaceae bacterium]|nr:TIGR02281 family clan AA aspartic protease [Rhodobiaceae bacterium]
MFRTTLSSVTNLLIAVGVGIGLVMVVKPDTFQKVFSEVATQAAAPQEKQKSRPNNPGIVALSADRGGHFQVSALINGTYVNLMADTGASLVALSYEEAKRLGLKPESLPFNGTSMTANGAARIAFTVLDTVTVGPITLRNVKAAVAEPGALSTNLLGMSFIGRLSRFELKGDQLVLHR